MLNLRKVLTDSVQPHARKHRAVHKSGYFSLAIVLISMPLNGPFGAFMKHLIGVGKQLNAFLMIQTYQHDGITHIQ